MNVEEKVLKEANPEISAERNKWWVPSGLVQAMTFKVDVENKGNEPERVFQCVGELTCATLTLPALKERGNEAFAGGDYETAILCYSEGLEKLKDMKVLYTNRAQVSEPRRPQGFLRPQSH